MWKKIRELLSDAAVYGTSGIIGQLVGFFLLPLYTRYLDPTDFGIVAMLTLFSTLYVPVANLGMTNAVFRRFNLSKNAEERSVVLFTGAVSVLVSTMLLGALCLVLAPQLTTLLLGAGGAAFLVQLTILTAILESLIAVPTVILRADRRVQTIAVASVSRLLLTICSTIVLVVYAELGVLGVVVGNLCGAIFGLIAFGFLARRSFRPKYSTETWWAMLKYGAPFVPHHVQMVGLVMVGQYLVRQMDGLASAGMFNIALKFAIPVAFIVNSIQKAWVPFKFQVHAEEQNSEEIFRTTISYYFVAVSYLWVGVSFWGPELLRLMTAPDFQDGANYVAMAALVSATRGFRFMITTGMEFRENMRALPVITFIGFLVVVIACYVLIPVLGPNGAALGTSLGWLVIALLGYFVARQSYHVKYDWQILGGSVLTASLLVAVGQCAQHNLAIWERLGIAVLACIAYPCVALVLLLNSAEERTRVLEYLGRVRNFLRSQI